MTNQPAPRDPQFDLLVAALSVIGCVSKRNLRTGGSPDVYVSRARLQVLVDTVEAIDPGVVDRMYKLQAANKRPHVVHRQAR